jgi:hypothetical protein
MHSPRNDAFPTRRTCRAGWGVLARLARHGIADAAEREELVRWSGQLQQSGDPMVIRQRIDLHEALGEARQAGALRASAAAAAMPVVERVRAILAGG